MFGARKKFVEFVEVVDNDFTDESMYYNQPSMFPHRSDKDVSFVSISARSFFVEVMPGVMFYILNCLLIKCFPLDAVLSFTVAVRPAITAWRKFVWSTEYVCVVFTVSHSSLLIYSLLRF